MKLSLKILTGLVGAFSLAVGMSYPTLAQTRQTPGTNPNPSIFNDPLYNNQQPNRQQPNIIVPESSDSMSLESIVSESPSFTIFNSLLRVAQQRGAELVTQLGSEDEYTVYAPTDQAFAALPEGTIRTLVQPENEALLEQILAYHIVPGEVSVSDQSNTMSQRTENSESVPGMENQPLQQSDRETATIVLDENAQPARGQETASAGHSGMGRTENRESVPGMQNQPLEQSDRETATIVLNEEAERSPMLQADGASGMRVNNARVIGTSIQASNGVIYPIDQVVLPPSVQTTLGFSPQPGSSNQAF